MLSSVASAVPGRRRSQHHIGCNDREGEVDCEMLTIEISSERYRGALSSRRSPVAGIQSTFRTGTGLAELVIHRGWCMDARTRIDPESETSSAPESGDADSKPADAIVLLFCCPQEVARVSET